MPVTDVSGYGAILALPAPAQPPVQYSWWVWALGIALLVLIAAWYFWVFRSTRPKVPDDDPSSYDGVRAEHLALVDEAYQRFVSGEADLRELHLDLNHAIRSFATARTGIDTSSLTVAEFTRIEHGSALATVLGEYSEPAFAAVSDAQAAAACAEAREVIGTW
ncbi:MAG: hypothetical protein J0H73_08770 [Salana multivorans]|uniref:hypothetical protein n=1 Tax=Salana multivorans TaxID=120377 RepID=UPI00095E474D|nr:hypothetical protein [Salana multivorans]MBN8882392.1 hypothetical protein [Salana multivorans]OJX95450.1 MAG: hypothetical protein BGO96_11550 [Micrococcales bacterium 73-15]